jgi:hypothetical protein
MVGMAVMVDPSSSLLTRTNNHFDGHNPTSSVRMAYTVKAKKSTVEMGGTPFCEFPVV